VALFGGLERGDFTRPPKNRFKPFLALTIASARPLLGERAGGRHTVRDGHRASFLSIYVYKKSL